MQIVAHCNAAPCVSARKCPLPHAHHTFRMKKHWCPTLPADKKKKNKKNVADLKIAFNI